MSDVIQNIFSLPTPFNMVVVIVALGMVSGIITSIAKQIRKYCVPPARTRFQARAGRPRHDGR